MQPPITEAALRTASLPSWLSISDAKLMEWVGDHGRHEGKRCRRFQICGNGNFLSVLVVDGYVVQFDRYSVNHVLEIFRALKAIFGLEEVKDEFGFVLDKDENFGP